MVDCDRREVQQAIPSLIRFIHYSLNPTSGIIQITFKGTLDAKMAMSDLQRYH